ncbi:MAG: hypothetical protein HY794_13405 [Desulfarculus sp.]|nr:hypothetical protein [Desulfarculus sp.]
MSPRDYQELLAAYEHLHERVVFLEGANADLAGAVEDMRRQRDKARKELKKAILRQLEYAETVRRLRAGEAV